MLKIQIYGHKKKMAFIAILISLHLLPRTYQRNPNTEHCIECYQTYKFHCSAPFTSFQTSGIIPVGMNAQVLFFKLFLIVLINFFIIYFTLLFPYLLIFHLHKWVDTQFNNWSIYFHICFKIPIKHFLNQTNHLTSLLKIKLSLT